MSTDHESHTFHIENEDELRHANKLNQVYLITNAVGFGLAAGIVIGLVLDGVLGSTIATATGTILGSILGGLIGIILARIDKRKREAELLAIVRGRDDGQSEEL